MFKAPEPYCSSSSGGYVILGLLLLLLLLLCALSFVLITSFKSVAYFGENIFLFGPGISIIKDLFSAYG